MPVITELRVPFRGSKLRSIVLDGEQWRSTSSAVVRELGLAEGDHIDTRQLEAQLVHAEGPIMRERALRLLGYREHGTRELLAKLMGDGYPEDSAQTLVTELERMGLVDDARYARVLARTFLEGRRYGKGRARREMLRRGLPEDLVVRSLEALRTDDQEYSEALALALGLAARTHSLERLAARLARKGFSPELCFRAAREALAQADTPFGDDAL